MSTQVSKQHYQFSRYMTRPRWASLWHQVDEVMRLDPESVLEIGPGPGVFKSICGLFGLAVETLDTDPELGPDHVGSATHLHFADGSYDVVCAFQMLEHLPYAKALDAFREMVRVSRGHLLISLPDVRRVWRYRLHLPKIGPWDVLVPRPLSRPRVHEFDGQHYWELGKKGYDLNRIVSDFTRYATLLKTYRVQENPYHRFFVFEVR